jgi:hypothetical protein
MSRDMVLQEPDDHIIASINNIDFNKNGDKFLLNDYKTGNIFMYSMDGNLDTVFSPGFYLTESAVHYYKKEINFNNYWIVGKEIRIVALEEYNEFFGSNLTQEEHLRFRKNEFGQSIFLNDSTILTLAHIGFSSIEADSNKPKHELDGGMLNQTAIVKIHLNSGQSEIIYMNPDQFRNKEYREIISLRPFNLFHYDDSYFVYNSNDLISDTCSLPAPVIIEGHL